MINWEQLFSGFDYVDELIYVSDMDTYELVYCNKKAEQIFSFKEGSSYHGNKCYECIQEQNHPCVFCNNDKLKQNKKCIWTRTYPKTGSQYLLYDSEITILGKPYRLEIALEKTFLDASEEHAYQMMDMENYLTHCVRKLVKSQDFSNSVSTVLQTVLNYYEGERAYLFEFDWKNETARNTYEICSPGITAEIDNLQNIPFIYMQFWMEQFSKKETLIIEDLSLIKDEPSRKTEYETLVAQGINSIIAVPFYFGQRMGGFIGVDNPQSNFNNTDYLVNLSYFIGVEIEKHNMVHELLDGSYKDSLTGVYNRKGFDQLVSTMPAHNHAIGFGVLDVDNFKLINDTFGHETGDTILREVGELLLSVIREDDIVFRLGGDEFGILLNNCTENAWDTICAKLQLIHACLLKNHVDMTITLSMGICFSTNRVDKKIYKLADEALYYIKKNGRAGCAMVLESTGEKKSWFDDISSQMKTILEYNDTVLFRVEFSKEKGKKPNFICSNMAKTLFGFPADTSPEECYQRWYDGIDSSYVDAVKELQEQMINGVQVECTYLWNHSRYGKINIRTIGNSECVNGVRVIYGYHHFLRDTQIIERIDESKLIVGAISRIYAGSYYINVEDGSYVSLRNAPNEHLLQIQRMNIREDFKKYNLTLIQPEYQARMKEFCDIDTLAARLKNQSHLDCEYRSAADNRWYRASFIPVKYSDTGKLTHVLFELVLLDEYMVQETEKNIKNERTIESLYNHVPGGLVMYEWNGKELKVLHKSRYYIEHYGDVNQIVPSIVPKKIHKEDWEALWKTIINAQDEIQTLNRVYRVWDDEKGKYVWEKIDAVCEKQPDGTILAYTLYSDVTEQKEIEHKLQKRNISLHAALNAANQLCYEYDTVEHTGICFTAENFFGLPKYIENYPDCLRDMDLIHPEDIDTFIQTAHKIDNGSKNAQCNVRMKRDGEYRWYSCTFDVYFDTQKERNVAILNFVDITMRMVAMHQYEERLRALLASKDKALAMCLINISKNTFEMISNSDDMSPIIGDANTFETAIQSCVKCIIVEDSKKVFLEMFSRENLLRQAAEGKLHSEMEYLMELGEGHYEWITALVDLVKNPISGEIKGVAYCRSSQIAHMTNTLLEKALEDDYLFAAAIFVDTDEFYLYNSSISRYLPCMKDFWNVALKDTKMHCSEEVTKQLKAFLVKENVLRQLVDHSKVVLSYDCLNNSMQSRLEFRFSYMDESHTMLLGTMRDVTDSQLLEKYRYDNEHDHITKLFNRSKFILESEKRLKENPTMKFAMVHFDIKNFHLYNTFFGEDAGDKLLCDMADMVRRINTDYNCAIYGRLEADVFGALIPFDRKVFDRHVHYIRQQVHQYRNDFLLEPKIGVYLIEDRNMKMESVITRVSIAANSGKLSDTNIVSFYDEVMEQKLREQQLVVNDMQTAIEQEQFKVFLQGKYNMRTGELVGAEALVRWQHPKRGLISPNTFISIFEGNGFIMTLDRYMWEHTCQILCKRREQGKKMIPISVNVSRISIFNPTTVTFLKELIEKYDIDPMYLELELTESAYVENPDIIKPRLHELQKYGFVTLMDDFGSGYSSLNSLKDLPVDILKLDMKFLSASEDEERSRIVLSSIIQMAHMLNLAVIAEGVEKYEQAEALLDMDCEYAQGYLYAKPIPENEFGE